jgi:hypothetical protein
VLLNFLPFVPIHGWEALVNLIDTIVHLFRELLHTLAVLIRIALVEEREPEALGFAQYRSQLLLLFIHTVFTLTRV